MRNINLALTWYLATVFSILFAVLMFINFSLYRSISSPVAPQFQLYKSLPASALSSNKQEVQIAKNDARVLIVKNFLDHYKSPLSDYAQNFVNMADKYHLDFKLMPAIAMHESSGGKKTPKGTNNPFGYGEFEGKILKFNSYEQAIETVAIGLSNDYMKLGLKTPEEIMPKYNLQDKNNDTSWAIKVSNYILEIK